MNKLLGWTAKRAGGRITINAFDAEGKPIKVVGVDKITGGQGVPTIATDKKGECHELA
ncbi:MAG: hypothetical protein IKE42_15240 [Aquamicrobium sp.]|nr:hypothetical protein [Aquamicrobium sp.]